MAGYGLETQSQKPKTLSTRHKVDKLLPRMLSMNTPGQPGYVTS